MKHFIFSSDWHIALFHAHSMETIPLCDTMTHLCPLLWLLTDTFFCKDRMAWLVNGTHQLLSAAVVSKSASFKDLVASSLQIKSFILIFRGHRQGHLMLLNDVKNLEHVLMML